MSNIIILSEQELRECVQLDLDAVACVEQAFTALAGGGVVMPPILRLDIEKYNGEVDVKTAYVPGLDSFAMKISPGFFDNPKLGIPSLNGLVVLFSAKTGLAEALLLDNGYLTAIRTAAAGATAAKWLSRGDSKTATILGAGEQGRLQLKALTLVRPIQEARYWARTREEAESAATAMAAELGITVTATTDAAEAVSGADIIVTATPATSPILLEDMIEPGQHVTAMGSDAEHKNEIDPAIIAKAQLYVPDSLQQTQRLGELHHAIEADLIASDRNFPELGTVISGAAAGRPSAEAVTVADLTGTGVQDTAIATLARQRALALNSLTQFNA